MHASASSTRLLAIGLVAAVANLGGWGVCGAEQSPNYTVETQWLTQPVDHAHPDGPTFQQQVLVLRPRAAADDSIVFFMLGNEVDQTAERLEATYRNYGSPDDVIFIAADHRGYGQSVPDIDQTVPGYVRVDQALADYDRLISVYRFRYPGKWIGAGCSYGGSLVINLAHDYPQDLDVVLASSPPVDLRFLTPEYAVQAARNLGPELAGRMQVHMRTLTPGRPYDESWQNRERLVAVTAALAQRQAFQPLKEPIARLAALPTDEFLRGLDELLPQAVRDQVDDWAVRRIPNGVSAEMVRTGRYNWYTWKYQQCTETGTFFTGGLFPHAEQEHVDDCRATFGEDPPYLHAKPWPIRQMLAGITKPIVFVAGGKDPWTMISVKPGDSYPNIDYQYFPDGLHCPDVYEPEVGPQVFSRLREKLMPTAPGSGARGLPSAPGT